MRNLKLDAMIMPYPALLENATTKNVERIQVCSFKDMLPTMQGKRRIIHDVHPYPAKLIPHIPFYFINNKNYLTTDGVVGDYFCGSGTVLVESSIAHHKSIGIDVNPLAALISKVKTTPLDAKILLSEYEKLSRNLKPVTGIELPDFPNRDFWFSSKVSKQLMYIRQAIENTSLKKEYRDFFTVCFSSIIRTCSNADPRISPPVFSKRMRSYKMKNRKIKPIELFKRSVSRNSHKILLFSNMVDKKMTRVIHGDSRSVPLKKNCLDLVITSPPYVDAQKYMRSSKLELYWLGLTNQREFIKFDVLSIGNERNNYSKRYVISNDVDEINTLLDKLQSMNYKRAHVLEKYLYEMNEVLNSIYRSLDKNGKLVLVIGNNKMAGLRIPLDFCLIKLAEKYGFEWSKTFVDTIKSRGYMTKRNKTSLMDSERIIILQK